MTSESVSELGKVLPQSAGAYALGPDDGEALWMNGGLGLLKATGSRRRGATRSSNSGSRKVSPHRSIFIRDEDEFFVVLDGEIRIQHGDEVIEGVSGSLAYTPRGVAHSFHVDSDEARLLLIFGPAGPEGFFREVGKAARFFGMPPVDEQFVDRATVVEIMARHGQTMVGPPLGPKV